MNKKNNGKNTERRKKSVKGKHEKKVKQKKAIFQEISLNMENMDAVDNNTNKEEKKKKKKHKVLRAILTIILIGFLILAGIFIKRMNENGWTMGGFVATILGHDSTTASKLPRINILVVGQSQNLTDTLLVCTFDPKTQDFGMLSIPRDTFVGRNKNNATASDKINAVYQIDPNQLLTKVNDITGLGIKYYIKVDTKGFRDLVDSIGGIYFDVPVDMDYDDVTQDLHIHLKQGYQLLDGDKAEQCVRFRHNNDGTTYPRDYGEQDLGRMRTQREFITEVIKQLVKPKNITAIDDYIKIANENIETNFSIWTLKDYAPYLLDFKTENLETGTLPGVPEKINNLWFYSYNKKEAKELIQKLFRTELTKDQEANAKIKVKILNGTTDENNLTNMQNLLKESGYTIDSVGTTSKTTTTTIINRSNRTDEIANKLKETIGVGMIANSTKEKDSSIDFTIIIGDDYN